MQKSGVPAVVCVILSGSSGRGALSVAVPLAPVIAVCARALLGAVERSLGAVAT